MRVKTDVISSSRIVYNDFKLKNPDLKIEFKEWKEICYLFNESFRDYILNTGDREKLPCGFGSFTINKKKRVVKMIMPSGKEKINLSIDWKKTKEKGKYIYNFNHNTDGYYFGWKWFKEDARFKNSKLWRFKPSRVSSRLIKTYLQSDKDRQHIYLEWK